jgi:hypothetical protein
MENASGHGRGNEQGQDATAQQGEEPSQQHDTGLWANGPQNGRYGQPGDGLLSAIETRLGSIA